MRVGFGGREVEVVFGAAAGESDVELFAGQVLSTHHVAAVPGGGALGAVDGAGIAEGDVFGDVVGRQGDLMPGAAMASPERSVAGDIEDVEGVAVADVVSARQGQPAGVVAGTDDVSDAGAELIGEHDFTTWPPVRVSLDEGGQTGSAGAGLEVVDDRVGGPQQQQAVAPRRCGRPATPKTRCPRRSARCRRECARSRCRSRSRGGSPPRSASDAAASERE